MEDKQKVYIKGNPNRCDEIIKILENLGGRNLYCYLGDDNTGYYYINPNGVIVHASTKENIAYSFLREFYKEIKLPRWKPEYKEHYYRINWIGVVTEDIWYGSRNDELRYKFGNCFKTFEDAKSARDKIKEILNK